LNIDQGQVLVSETWISHEICRGPNVSRKWILVDSASSSPEWLWERLAMICHCVCLWDNIFLVHTALRLVEGYYSV
jgi:hypothetical protein